jgi:hypothetical protein
MSWALGYDFKWMRDIGYSAPAYCDHPGCMAEIDRGLSYVCGSKPHGGEHGCGLYFCAKHHSFGDHGRELCERCLNGQEPFLPTADHPSWINHQLTDESWQLWRDENPEEVARMKGAS